MSSRTPSTPPELDGYRYLGLLGSGGFADVFSYQQLRPRREVAVKVLLRGLGEDTQRQFEHEANLMALLSNHPSIVSIYAASIAPDGRPYLVMENCQPRHLGARIKTKPLSVGRALTIGIQVAGAVETAHRLGVLHRDIKPANILFTEFGRPALTDFGISLSEGGSTAVAFSPAWAPPEQIENRPMGPSGDVYSLAATVWAMLVGRSPFDVPGDNGSLAVTHRVKTQPPPPTGRTGVPDSLERILRTALAKSPDQRYATALEFARALQGVQAELHESVTTIEVRDERADDDLADETETGTRVTGFALIDPDGPTGTAHRSFEVSDSRGTRPTGDTASSSFSAPAAHPSPPRLQIGPYGAGAGSSAPTANLGGNVLMHGRGSLPASDPLEFTGPALPQAPAEATVSAAVEPAPTEAPPAAPRRRSPLPWVLLGAVALVVAGLAAAWLAGGLGRGTVVPTPSMTAKPRDPVGELVAAPTKPVGKASGSKVVFTWSNPAPQAGDRFSVRQVFVDRDEPPTATSKPTITVARQQGPTCIEVQVVRANGQFSVATKGCFP